MRGRREGERGKEDEGRERGRERGREGRRERGREGRRMRGGEGECPVKSLFGFLLKLLCAAM